MLVGTAGWTIPRVNASTFPLEGSSLERYSARLHAVEINSSFHREHRMSTWQRWHDSVPATFRFSVKLPKTITHQAKLCECAGLLEAFLQQVRALDDKLAVLLVQLPPKLEFDFALVRTFFRHLRDRSTATLACEPRNSSWFTGEADALLEELEVARVAADPAICEVAAAPGGWRGLNYWRLHGSPVVYRSSYLDRVPELARRIAGGGAPAWCIFDNTASSAAMTDALALADVLGRRSL